MTEHPFENPAHLKSCDQCKATVERHIEGLDPAKFDTATEELKHAAATLRAHYVAVKNSIKASG